MAEFIKQCSFVRNGVEQDTVCKRTQVHKFTSSREALDVERQVTKPTPPLQNCRSRTEFLHSRSRSKAVAPDTMCRAFF